MVRLEAESIIWDLDGTMLDSFGVFEEVLSDILPTHNRELPAREVLAKNYHGSLDDSINSALGGMTPEELEKIVADFLSSQSKHYDVIEHHIFPDALRLAQRADTNKTFQVLVTNRNHEGRLNASPRSIVERSAFAKLINKIICGDDSEHRKPKLEVVDTLLNSGQLRPESTVVIGDQFVDAQFARNIGARAILVCRDGGEIPHLDKLGEGWEHYVDIVASLDEVEVV